MMQSAFSTENNDTEAGPNTADEDFNKEERKLRDRVVKGLQGVHPLGNLTPDIFIPIKFLP